MKKVVILILTLLFAVSWTGCGTNSLAAYKKAVDKTNQITKGQSSGTYAVKMDFNTEGMTPDERKELNYYSNMSGSFRAAFDDETEKSAIRNNLNFGGLGFDFDIFIDGNNVVMKLPIIGKYMRMDEIMNSTGGSVTFDSEEPFVSEQTKKEISAKWVGVMKEDDVFRGKDIVLTTPDGEVKTTVYTITMTDEQIKSLAGDSIDILSKDKVLEEKVNLILNKKSDNINAKSYQELLSNWKEQIRKVTIESFNYTAYVDIDRYIVNEVIEVSAKINDSKQGCAKNIDYHLELKNWDINKDQKIDFPELNGNNTIKLDDMDQNMPDMMKDLFQVGD